jgi:16S rRNA (adenine1518-N6/adenine1519-N6)-dimethyltransferase
MVACSRLVKFNDPGPKKRFGQHFLRDTGILDRIIRWIQPAAEDFFLEIGAGRGALTARLAESGARLLAVELDGDCIPLLEKAMNSYESAEVIPGDILKMDLSELFSSRLRTGHNIRIAGNLPYNIGTAIIERLLRLSIPVEDMVFMLQLEVAQRIVAPVGSRQYGYFSVFCRHFAEAQLGFKISPACFVPRPKVSSALVSLRPKSNRRNSELEACFEAVAKAAFAYRRKTLENAFRRHSVLGQFTHTLLKNAGIDGSRRAEQLSVYEYENLAQAVHDFSQASPSIKPGKLL